jgi:hypothetical protein
MAISEIGIVTDARRWSTNIDILGNRRPDTVANNPGLDENGFVVLIGESNCDMDLDVNAKVINLDLEVTARWQRLANANLNESMRLALDGLQSPT